MNPLPGDIGLCRISGTTGRLVSAGQCLIGSGSYYTHAFVYVGAGEVIQAEPGGAKRVFLSEALNGRRRVAYSSFPLTDAQRGAIVSAAESLIGTPYSYLDYAAIGAARLAHIDALERFVENTHHMICSQLVDECYRRAGIELFPNRIPGDVAPGDLARLIGA
jgi:cell wall-associated NlpC family hydrolase